MSEILNLANRIDRLAAKIERKSGLIDPVKILSKIKNMAPNLAAKLILSLRGWVEKLLSDKKTASLHVNAIDKKKIGLILGAILAAISGIYGNIDDPELKSDLNEFKAKVQQAERNIEDLEDEKSSHQFRILEKCKELFGENKKEFSADEVSVAKSILNGKSLEEARKELKLKKKVLHQLEGRPEREDQPSRSVVKRTDSDF